VNLTRGRILIVIAVLAALLVAFGRAPAPVDHGNTLLAVSSSPPDSIDPGVTYMAASWQILFNIYDGLLTYKHQDNEHGGADLVPDLATAMPVIEDGGKTYKFTMRKGVMFAPPINREVLPSDMKWGIKRLFKLPSQGMGWYQGIDGAQEFIEGKAKDVPGIVIDDDARTIEFHLIEADPVFNFKLAMLFAVPVPKETPAKDMSFEGFVPGTGPYMFKSYEAQRKMVLVRNPNFKQWSNEVPKGNVDSIEIKLGVSPENAVTQIRRGDADYLLADPIPKAKLFTLLADSHWKKNVEVEDEARISYVFMNTQVEPFNHKEVRQAVNWAIDRRAMIKLAGGQGHPTENILPIGFPGYKKHELYPGPDMDKAKALIAKSGVKPGTISFWCMNSGGSGANSGAEYMQKVLGELGFTVQLKCLDPGVFYTTVGNPSVKPQIGIASWGQDFPEGSDFIDVLLNGKRIMPKGNSNYSVYKGSDKEIAKANSTLKLEDREKAWAAIDRKIAEDGPWAVYLSGIKYQLIGDRVKDFESHPTYEMMFSKISLKGADS
jgi:peptide/nickel transport system substrate-binding protein